MTKKLKNNDWFLFLNQERIKVIGQRLIQYNKCTQKIDIHAYILFYINYYYDSQNICMHFPYFDYTTHTNVQKKKV